MEQSRLFYNDEFEALRSMVEQGQGYKKTAAHLWPALKPESAYARLKACVNEHGDQRLKFGEIVEAMKFNNRFDPLYFICDETCHDRPPQHAPEDRAAALMREFNMNVQRLGDMAGQLQALGVTASALRVAK